MNPNKKWRFGALVTAGAMVALAFPVVAVSGAASAAASGTVGGHVNVNSASIAKYWTAARMKSAKDVSVVSAGVASLTAASPNDQGAGTPGTAAPGAPAKYSGARATPTPDGLGTGPGSFDSFPVPTNLYKTFQYEQNGKVFFTNDGANYVCSGTVVGSVNGSGDENEVWTAGHCLSNTESLTGVVDSSLEFVPAYNGNQTGKKAEPFGVFTWNGGWETTTGWLDFRDFSLDEAAFTVNANKKGQILGNDTGWAGFAWNYSPYEDFFTFGYPATSPYAGNLMEENVATTYELDTGVGGGGSAPIGIGSDFTGGSSGGGWQFGWTPSGPGYVNGHNDYTYSNVPDVMFSPYQDTLSNVVRCFGAGSC
jgi:hypothetical protein